jgi:hypothetical protein
MIPDEASDVAAFAGSEAPTVARRIDAAHRAVAPAA